MKLKMSAAFASVSLGLASVSAAWAQPGGEEPLLEIRTTGLHAAPVHEKDRALHAAFVQLGERLADLEVELELDPMQAAGVRMAWDLLSGGLGLRLDGMDENGPRGMLVSRPGGRADAAGVYERLGRMLEEAGLPVERSAPDAMRVETPGGVVDVTRDGEGVYVRLGETGAAPAGPEAFDLPAGATTVLSGTVDIGGLMAVIGPQLEEAMAEMPAGMGLEAWLSAEAPRMRFAVGTEGGRLHYTQRVIDAVAAMEASGVDRSVSFGAADFRKAPVDTVRMYAVPVSLGHYLKMFDAMMAEQGEDPIGELSEMIGVDLRGEVLANIGPKAMVYQSESTGGGGLFSLAAVMSLVDAEAFGAAHAKLVSRANAGGEDELNGYVRIRSWNADGVAAYSLTTPGLPVPMEISWAVVGSDLVAAVSPMGLRAAVGQARSGRSSVLDNPLFARAVTARMPRGGAAQVSFADAARLAGRGYGLTGALMAAVSNGVRSPLAPERASGELMPGYAAFTAGIEPAASIGWWDGDDYRVHAVADGSVVVGIAAAVGSVADMQALLIPAFGAGVLLPAIGNARGTATELVSATQVRTVAQAMNVYAVSNNDRMPESLEELLEQGLLTDEILMSPYGPAPDGGPSIAAMVGRGKTFTVDSTEIFAIDRAMMFQGLGVTNVVFADEHTEKLTYEQLEAYLELPQNEGAREALGIVAY